MKIDKKIAILLFFIIAFIVMFVLSNLNQHELRREDKERAIRIALSDERVKEEICNKEYEIIDVGYTSIEIVGPNETFSGEVPVVQIIMENVTLMVFIDFEQEKVISIGYEWEKSFPPP